jgi:hypothetical protein
LTTTLRASVFPQDGPRFAIALFGARKGGSRLIPQGLPNGPLLSRIFLANSADCAGFADSTDP